MGQKLNCKPGDLAIVVKSHAGNEGKVVRCLELQALCKLQQPDGSYFTGPAWVIDQGLVSWGGVVMHLTPDDFLRPLRDDDGVDEMLVRTGLPNKETAE